MTVREDIIYDLTEISIERWPGIVTEVIAIAVDKIFRHTKCARDLREHAIDVLDIAYTKLITIDEAINERFKTTTENVFSI